MAEGERQIRRIAILGTAPSTRGDVPWGVPGLEFWSLNDAWKLPGYADNCTVWFEMHKRDWFTSANRPPDHLQWLQKFDKGPIYFWEKFDDIPNSVAYPFDEMCKMFPGANLQSYVIQQGDKKMTHFEEGKGYLTSSIAYMMAIALSQMQAGDELHFWGVDLAADTEYFRQRPNFEYLAGWAEGRDIKIAVPKACPLLKGPFYGRDSGGQSRDEFVHKLEQLHYKEVNAKRHLEAQLVKAQGGLEVLEKLRAEYATR